VTDAAGDVVDAGSWARSRLPKTWVMEAISASELAEITPWVNA
jgi:hypothetical protein